MANTAAPYDANYKPELAGIVPGVGWAALQLGTPTNDSATGWPTGPAMVHQVVGTPVTASATGAAGATATATLPGVSGKTTYITGFTVTSGNPAATVVGLVTVTGAISGTMNYQFTESATLGGELIVTFPIPIPASAAAQAIAVIVPTIASGAVVAVTAYGYQL